MKCPYCSSAEYRPRSHKEGYFCKRCKRSFTTADARHGPGNTSGSGQIAGPIEVGRGSVWGAKGGAW